MKQLDLSFTATHKVGGAILFSTMKKPFKTAIKVRNRKEKDLQGVYEWIEKAPPKHYGTIKIKIKGSDEAVEKEAEIIEEFLANTLKTYQKTNREMDNKINEALRQMGLSVIGKFKECITKVYLSIGIAVDYNIKKIEAKDE